MTRALLAALLAALVVASLAACKKPPPAPTTDAGATTTTNAPEGGLPAALPSEPRAFVELLYGHLVRSDWSATREVRRRAFTADLLAARASRTLFFDEFTDSQDPAPHFRVDPAHEKDGKITVPVAFDFTEAPKGEPTLRVVLVRGPSGLRIDDFDYGDRTLRAALAGAEE